MFSVVAETVLYSINQSSSMNPAQRMLPAVCCVRDQFLLQPGV